MNDLNPLEARLDAMLRATDEQRAHWREHAHECMRAIGEKTERFNKVAVALMTTAIRPRMELVVRKFKTPRSSTKMHLPPIDGPSSGRKAKPRLPH